MSGQHANTPEHTPKPVEEPSTGTTSTGPTTEEPISVEQQRADVAETVAALAAKADVPTRVANEASYQTGRAAAAARQNPEIVAATVGAVVVGIIVTVVLRRRRSRRVLR